MFSRLNRVFNNVPLIRTGVVSRPLSSSSNIQAQITSRTTIPNPNTTPTTTDSKFLGRRNEKVVFWKLYANFPKHNTHLSLVAVVEDLDFVEKNPNLSHNDKVLYYLQLPHHPKLHISAGQLGFRKSNRQEYEAAYQVATKMFKTIEEKNLIGPNDKVELIMKDFGKGRPPFLAALQGKEGTNIRSNIVRISDNTKLRFGGARPKKQRRLG
jgi:small subunit ribosomal protein S11